MARALLIRHCQTTGQHPEAPLTELGEAQARTLVPWLRARGVDHVVSSPYARAVASIRPFAEATGLALNVDERLHERVIAPTPIDHWRDVIARAFVDPDHREPGGESGREVQERAQAAITEVLDQGHRLPSIVGHGHLFALVLHAIDPAFGFEQHAAMTNPDVFELHRDTRGLRFTRIWTPDA